MYSNSYIATWVLIAALSCPGRAHADASDTVFMIMIDGASQATIQRLYKAGKLPSMKALVDAKQGRLLRTVTTFPSATAPSVPELMVGRYSDRCHADLLKRVQGFDRNTGRISRYEFLRGAWDSPDDDLFDQVAKVGRRSFSYFEGEFGSASRNEFNPLGYRLEFATGYANLPTTNYDRQVIDRVIRDLAAEKPPPALVFIGLGAADIDGHSRGPDSPDYERSIISNDHEIGRLIDATRTLPHPRDGTLFDHSHFFIFGDHGMAKTEHILQLGRDLNQVGLITADGADLGAMLQATFRPKWYKNVDLIVLGIGSNVADILVRHRTDKGRRRSWSERPSVAELRALPVARGVGTIDLISFLTGHVGIAKVLVREQRGEVAIFTPGGGEALVAREGGPETPRRFGYQVRSLDAQGRDPLGYLAIPEAAALTTTACADQLAFHDEQAWFEATKNAEHPYAPALIPKAFEREPTAPDVVVTAQPGFGFLPLMHGDHGNLRADSLTSFLLAAGPYFTKGPDQGATVRLIDLNVEVRRALDLAEDPLSDSHGLSPQ